MLRVLVVVVLVAAAAAMVNNCTGNLNAHRGGVENQMVGRGKLLNCGMSEAQVAATGTPRATWKDYRWYVGEHSADLKRGRGDPIFISFKAGVQQFCRTDYETTQDDVIGYGIVFNKADNDTAATLYAVFSTVGAESGCGTEDFRRFSTGGWLKNYGGFSTGNRKCHEGAAEIPIVAKLNPWTGDVEAASYMAAERVFGSTASVKVTKLDHMPATLKTDEQLVITTTSRAMPLRPDTTRMRCTTMSPFAWTVSFAADLRSVVTSSAGTGCV